MDLCQTPVVDQHHLTEHEGMRTIDLLVVGPCCPLALFAAVPDRSAPTAPLQLLFAEVGSLAPAALWDVREAYPFGGGCHEGV